MKYNLLAILVVVLCLSNIPVFSQTETEEEASGLPGDNLSLYAVLDLFQKSKTIEDFEKDLNLEKTGINNLDLDLDGKVDFIKVTTTQKDDDFTFVLQVAVSATETQDVAVILVSKDEKKEVTMQIVGDKDLYGENYIIEPQTKGVTANPGYTGEEPVKENVPATTQTIVVQSTPIVQYVYSPVYVPYYPPYYYGYYPPYYAAFTVMAAGIYWSNHSYYHHHHHGGYGYGHSTVIINHNTYNNYNNNRHGSNTVAHNKANGSYRNNSAATRPSTGASATTRPSTGAATRPSTGAATRPSTGAATRPSTGNSAAPRPSTTPTSRPSTSPATRPSTSPATRPSTSPATRPSSSPSARPSSSSMGASRSMNSGGYSGASRGSYSGASRGGGGYSGGGGGGRRR